MDNGPAKLFEDFTVLFAWGENDEWTWFSHRFLYDWHPASIKRVIIIDSGLGFFYYNHETRKCQITNSHWQVYHVY